MLTINPPATAGGTDIYPSEMLTIKAPLPPVVVTRLQE
jgi:hypothetical protein